MGIIAVKNMSEEKHMLEPEETIQFLPLVLDVLNRIGAIQPIRSLGKIDKMIITVKEDFAKMEDAQILDFDIKDNNDSTLAHFSTPISMLESKSFAVVLDKAQSSDYSNEPDNYLSLLREPLSNTLDIQTMQALEISMPVYLQVKLLAE